MPLYEYECNACGRRFEQIRRFSDPPLDQCVFCQDGPVLKLMSAPAIHFKGTGWYVTDYAGKKGDGTAGSSLADNKESADSKDSKDGKDSKDTKDTKDKKDSAPAMDSPAAASSDTGKKDVAPSSSNSTAGGASTTDASKKANSSQ